MWLVLAFVSAFLLGCYDSFKKKALSNNAVLPVLFLNTFFSSLFFLPSVLLSHFTTFLDTSIFHVAECGWEDFKFILLKSCLVLSSWLFGYFGIKHLPLTIVGPINSTRPVMVLLGAFLIFGERLNLWQWIGVLLAIISFFMLSKSGKKEGIDFKHNTWIFFVVISALLGAFSGLYDKFLMAPPSNGGVGLNKMAVQSWNNFFQCIMMLIVLVLLRKRGQSYFSTLNWHWSIPMVSLFLSVADFVYFYALSVPGAMISIISMIRRGSVIVSFLFGAIFFYEKNLRSKAVDLFLVMLGMLFLYIGSR